MQILDKNKKIQFVFDNTFPRLSAEDLADVEKVWNEQIEQKPYYFNGTGFSCSKLEDFEDYYKLYVHPLQFKVALWASLQKNFINGCKNMGVGVFVYDENYYYLVRRSSHSYTQVGKLSCVIGGVDYSEVSEKDLFCHIKNIAAKELSEEVQTPNTISPDSLEYLGAVYMPENNSVSFRFKAFGTITGVKNSENTEVVKVPINEFKDYCSTNQESVLINDYFIVSKLF